MVSYEDRGVSPHKPDVKRAIGGVQTNLYPGAFCWMVEDLLGGDPDMCMAMHADGSGTKSSLAYLHYRETGDASIFKGIAHDSLAMNVNDLIAVGAVGPFLLSNTIGRNAKLIPGEVIANLIDGYNEQCDYLTSAGVNILMAGGETADLGDVVRTTVVDSTITARMKRQDVVDLSNLRPDLVIVGLSSSGQSNAETAVNSGIATNGFSALRHDILSSHYKENYPEAYAPEIADVAFQGRYRLSDPAPFSDRTIGEEILSPTRIYAPLIKTMLVDEKLPVIGIVNNSGGGQTKCLSFGDGIHFVKDTPFAPAPIFDFIKTETNASLRDMARTYNLGCLMECFVEEAHAEALIDIAKSFGIDAKIIGRTEASNKRAELTLNMWGETEYWEDADLSKSSVG